MLLLLLEVLLLVVSKAEDACSAAALPRDPRFPSEASSLLNPRSQRVVTRATNSELVDLGHPGSYTVPYPRSDCPYEEADLKLWTDVSSNLSFGVRHKNLLIGGVVERVERDASGEQQGAGDELLDSQEAGSHYDSGVERAHFRRREY